jgi:hypothetical protein
MAKTSCKTSQTLEAEYLQEINTRKTHPHVFATKYLVNAKQQNAARMTFSKEITGVNR